MGHNGHGSGWWKIKLEEATWTILNLKGTCEKAALEA